MSKTVYEKVDFSGDAIYVQTNDTLIASFGKDFRFNLDKIFLDLMFHQRALCILTAPLGENAFTAIGECQLTGMYERITSTDNYRLFMTMEGLTGDLVGIEGYLEVEWIDDEDYLHYGGTLYF